MEFKYKDADFYNAYCEQLEDFILLEYFEDMKENNLQEKFKPDKIKARMVHGEKDEVISPEVAVNFARRFGLPITVMADEGHSLCNAQGTPDLVADMAIKFFTAE